MLRALFYLLLLYGMVAAFAARAADTCTFGTTCFCACASDADGNGNNVNGYSNTDCQTNTVKIAPGTVRICDDFENPDYNPDINGTAGSDSWADNCGISGYRACGAAFSDYWGAAGFNATWHDNEPSPTANVGDRCLIDPPAQACGTMEWTASDVFQANAYEPAMDIQTAGQVDDNVPGLTLTSEWDGTTYFAGRNPAGACVDSLGSKSFSGGTEVYFVARVALPTNLVDADMHVDTGGAGTCPENSDAPICNWKLIEWGPQVDFVFLGQTNGNPGGTSVFPFGAFLCKTASSTDAACDSAISSAMQIGTGQCGAGCGLNGSSGIVTYTPSGYDRSTDWPLGTWALVRFHLKGLGTSSCSFDSWWWHEDDAAEQHLISWSGFDCSTYVANSTLSPMLFNFYYNCGIPQCQSSSSGCSTTAPLYFYLDNVMVGTGSAPPAAADLGWGQGGDNGTGGEPPPPPASRSIQLAGDAQGAH